MPTIILLDVSVSMIRPVLCSDTAGSDSVTLLQLAQAGINYLLDYLATHEKLEFVALITFSSIYETYINFTRDFDLIRSKLNKIEEGDEASLEQGFAGATKLMLAEWGPSIPCNIVLFTDGSRPDLRSALLPLPFPFSGKLHIVSVLPPSSSSLTDFHRLVEKASLTPGCVLYPEPGPLSTINISILVKKLAEASYTTYKGILKCGNLLARIGLYPAPQPQSVNVSGENVIRTFSDTLEVIGFIDFANLASPMSVSRHLVTPLPSNKYDKIKSEVDGDDELDEGKMPSFCVLFHGALKVENVAALCTVGDDWFGVLYSWADSKKKSNLMLTVFEPGPDAVPWLGDLNYLGGTNVSENLLDDGLGHCNNTNSHAFFDYLVNEFVESVGFCVIPVPQSDLTGPASVEDLPHGSTEIPTFPVRPAEKRSYSQNTPVTWIRKNGLQADIQKVLRHAKKLPEKTQQFYKELNKLRRAAVSFGFNELLDGLAAILERECQTLPAGVHPDCALQLDHAIDQLRRPSCRDPKTVICPIRTRYQADHE